MSKSTSSQYGIATDLIGFRSTTLRVLITDIRPEYPDTIWIATADKLDSGTPLTIKRSQVTLDAPSQSQFHKTVRNFALKHKINITRRHDGIYTIMFPDGLHGSNPTAISGMALCKKYLRSVNAKEVI